MLHYYPQHVSNINIPIFRRTNCIHTASGIVVLELSEQSYINKLILYYDAGRKNKNKKMSLCLTSH